MMKHLLIFIILSCCSFLNAQVTISPSAFEVGDEITVTVDINSTDTDCNGFSSPAKVYLHSGIGDDSNPWGYSVIGNWGEDDGVGEMTDNGDDTWSITFTPETYYSLTTEQINSATMLGMVFRNEDGSQEFKDNGCNDFFFDIGAYQLTVTSPTQTTTTVSEGTNFEITATTSLASDFVLTANDVVIDNSTTNATEYSYNYTVNETTNFVLEATDGSETLSESFTIAVIPSVTEEALPDGLLDGINLDDSDDTKATLVLYAPGKDFVHVIGDFNNWEINDSFLMKKDSSKDRFWIELTGLTPEFNHLYQYLVEFDINVADPYSTLILDGYGNDDYINDTTYPNLPEYPSGQTEAITVLRTGDPEYDWQITDFEKPAKEDLVIYELLIRDFDELHSFDAVKSRLDYLQTLGINAIELMPVNEFDGNESWGYNPSFHMALDKYYGTKDALKALIDECHSRGIAVIIDVVYNHATGQHPYYRLWNTTNGTTGGQASGDSPFFNPTATHSYSVFNDFNHQQQATKDYVNRTVTYWIEEFKIDGMRWDLTKGFTQNCSDSDEGCTNSTQNDRIEVLQGYADNQWVSDPDFYVIFEHLGGISEEEQWANYRIDEGKGIMLWNKITDPYNEATMGYHEDNKSNFDYAAYTVKGFDQPSAISYMESHDEERLMYKNLEFGNSSGDYDVTELDTALSRMETAAAFFFTIPGPKMIWQFGELGYDISIDENGRTGNKPILWDYVEDPERYAIYQTWSEIIDLKLNIPIFKTDDFDIDANDSNGLKTIHLTDDSASGDDIKYVTVIGNFGLTTQSINPNFQETGTWYNLLNNSPITITNTSETISLEVGEFIIYGNNPYVKTDATIDDVNFTISTLSETCRDADNGEINVVVSALFDYNVSLTGPNSYNLTDSFSSVSWSVDKLSAGTYTLCFTVDGESDYEQCFDLIISEPEDLSVYSKTDKSNDKVSLELDGGDVYLITLNGITTETSDNSIELELEKGINFLKVTTGKDCQGVYEKTIFNSVDVAYYPNPVLETLYVYIDGNDTNADVKVYGLDGKLVKQYNAAVNDDRSIPIDFTTLHRGNYIVKIDGKTIRKTLKIVK